MKDICGEKEKCIPNCKSRYSSKVCIRFEADICKVDQD